MGLGLHGGGIESARFFAQRGAAVTVTDLRGEDVLRPAIDELRKLPIRYVLGKHEMADFANADIVVKNPAVPSDSPYLKAAPGFETDISIFLSLNSAPVIAITGTKGKSTTASAIHHVLKRCYLETRIGGNITVSPLSFFRQPDMKQPSDPVVLELSSWQLADLSGKKLLKPDVSLVTNILRDHLNRYSSMEDYIEDKKLILADQDLSCTAVLNLDDPIVRQFAENTRAHVMYFSSTKLPEHMEGGWLQGNSGFVRIKQQSFSVLPEKLLVKGNHNRLNMLASAVSLVAYGVPEYDIVEGLRNFRGIEHRLEFVATKHGIDFYNDSAATIPEATVKAVQSFEKPVRLIAGGTDKELDFEIFRNLGKHVKKIYLLEGSATDKMVPVLDEEGYNYSGPFASLQAVVDRCIEESERRDIAVFSPGCASFGMFLNEFDRGKKFKDIVAGDEI